MPRQSRSAARVHAASWKQLPGGGFRLWLTGHARVRVEADTFAEAEELLAEAILVALGDSAPNVEFAPPAPSGDDPAGSALAYVEWSARVGMQNAARLFADGACDDCGRPIGQRTGDAIAIERAPAGAQVLQATSSASAWVPGFGIDVFAGTLLDRLTPAERAAFDWRPVQVARAGKAAFFELVGSSRNLSLVRVRGRKPFGATCRRCSRPAEPFYEPATGYPAGKHAGAPSWYVAQSAIAALPGAVWSVGESAGFGLAFTAERWAAVRAGTPRLRVSATRIGVVPDGEVLTPARATGAKRQGARSS